MTYEPVWTQRDGVKIAVCDMTPSHARNSAAMLMRSAERLLIAHVMSGVYRHAPDEVIDDLVELDPEDYVRELPIYRALAARAEQQ